ncbi:hypothetical protein SAMN05421640_1550 [Ekhidna lutea]|uniref:Uncharacterized protein n=1 Tax=Ekhidna lutea TaxID=447679 RepID=A0A239HWR4_EKHLU|nr:hypothetical protein [Ekhidna lutea]SNS85769.1 hypothetical protein SAMN05421640_1550 [Ekhidna lutea]
MNQDPTENIAEILLNKSSVKQKTYRNVCKAFKQLHEEAKLLIDVISAKTTERDEDIKLSVTSISDQEFHIRIAGDLLVFVLHTNIITLTDDYDYNKSDYVKEKPLRKYLGQINVYNFMADSFEYNRLNDPGYLLARLLINVENHFIVEGDRQIGFMFESVSGKPLEGTDLNVLIKLIITQAAENDLIAPPFPKIRNITVKQQMEKSQSLGGGNKIGFQMSYQNDTH